MTKVCNIVPQVANSTSLVDSKLYLEINDVLKHQGLKGVTLRNKTKELFEVYNSDDYKNVFGDWKVYRDIKYNTENSKSIETFKTKYNSDIKLLEKSINLNNLNDLLEPKLISKQNSEVVKTNDILSLSHRPIISFKSYLDIQEFANKLNIGVNDLVETLIANGNIVSSEQEGVYYSNTIITNRASQEGSPIPSLYEPFTNRFNDEEFSENSIHHNSEDLYNTYSDAEIRYLNKVVSLVVVDDFDKFVSMFNELSRNKTSQQVQLEKINQYIVGKIVTLRNRIINNILYNITHNFESKDSNTYIKNLNIVVKKSSSSEEYKQAEIVIQELNKKYKVLDSTYLDVVSQVSYINRNYNNYISDFQEIDSDNSRSFVYRSFVAHLNKEYNVRINNDNSAITVEQEDADGTVVTAEFLTSSFNDRAALKIDRRKNVANDLKFKIAKCVSTEYIRRLTGKVDASSKYGMKEPISISDVWNTFISVSANSKSRQSMINDLKIINVREYNGVLNSFIQELETDDNIWNSFYSSIAGMSIVSNNSVNISSAYKGDKIIVSTQENNYMAFAENVAYQKIRSAIQIKLENNEKYLDNILHTHKSTGYISIHQYDTTTTAINNIANTQKLSIKDKYNWITTRLYNLGIDSYLSMQDILDTIQSENTFILTKTIEQLISEKTELVKELSKDKDITEYNRLKNIISDPNANITDSIVKKYEMLEKRVNSKPSKLSHDNITNTLNLINNKFDEVIKNLTYLTQNLHYIKNGNKGSKYDKGYANMSKTEKKRFRFKEVFDAKTSLKELGYLATIRNYSNTNHSYINENGDMEQSPQYPSFLTEFFDAIAPVKGVINETHAKEKLAHILNDPLYNTNHFIYNYDGFGLFNFTDTNGELAFDANGKPIVSDENSINPDFVKNFSIGMFSGMRFKDTNTGNKYESITGDNWLMMEIQSALRGRNIITSSDSSRSMETVNAKYGLKGFLFNSDGRYESYKDFMHKMNLINDNDEFVYRTEKDIHKDSIIYVEQDVTYVDKFSETVVTERKSFFPKYGDITNIDKIEKERLNLYRQLFRVLVNGYNNSIAITMLTPSYAKNKPTEYEEALKYQKENRTSEYYKIMNIPEIDTILESKYGVNNYTMYRDAIVKIMTHLTLIDKTNLSDSNFLRVFSDNLLNAYNNRRLASNLTLYQQLTSLNIPFEGEVYNLQRIQDLLEQNEIKLKRGKEYLDKSVVIENDNLLRQRYDEFNNSIQMKAIKNTVETELSAMQIAISKVFDFEQDWTNPKDGKQTKYVKNLKVKDSIANDDINRFESPMIHNGGKFLKDGVPTGQVFKFHRLSYISKKITKAGTFTEKVTLNTYAEKYIKDMTLLELVARMSSKSHPIKSENVVSKEVYNTLTNTEKLNYMIDTEYRKDIAVAKERFYNLLHSFINEVLKANQEQLINKTKSISDEIKAMIVDSIPATIKGTSETVSEHGKKWANLISTHSERTVGKEDIKQEKEETDDDKSNVDRVIDRQYNKAMLELFINSYINTCNISEDLLYGRPFEYKGAKDVNKRANETIKNGRSNDSNETFKSLTIGDIWNASNMLKYLATDNNIELSKLMDRFRGSMEVGNGLSMITVEEYKNRLKTVNMYEGKLKDYIEALDNPNIPFDYKKYTYIAEQLKYFLYTRKTSDNGIFQGSVMSYQEKNSTIVLFPKMFGNTKFEAIYTWMNKRGIDELNFKSGSKVGGQPVYNLHEVHSAEVNGEKLDIGYSLKTYTDSESGITFLDDRLDRSKGFDEDNIVDISKYLVTYKYSDLRVQQDTVSHIKNETGNLSTQWYKKVFVNMINDEDYSVGIDGRNKVYKGRTGDYRNRGLFENLQAAMSFNAKQDRDRLIYLWGGIKNGKIQRDEKGYIKVDVNKVRKFIQDWYLDSGDITISRAFEPDSDNNNEPLMSFNHPTIQRYIENLLQSKISDNVKAIIKQIHAPILPDVFIQPLKQEYNKNNIYTIEDYANNGFISYTKEFLKEQEEDFKNGNGENQFELKAQRFEIDKDGNKVLKLAQIVTNIWDSKFEQYRKTKLVTDQYGNVTQHTYIDIDEIPLEARTVICTRIPHEGMQSSFVAEVVGFMNTSSSQIIVPKHLAKQTGWDYDIDTLYVYPKELYSRKDKDGIERLYPISYEYDTHKDTTNEQRYNTRSRQLLEYVETYYSKELKNIELTRTKAIYEAKRKFFKLEEDLRNEVKLSNHKGFTTLVLKKGTVEFKDKVKELLALAGNMSTPDITALQQYYKHIGEGFQLEASAYKDSFENAIDDIAKNLDISDKEVENIIEGVKTNLSKQVPLSEINFDERMELLKNNLRKSIKEIVKEYKASIKEFMESDEIKNGFESQDELSKMTRATRNNMIVDSIAARVTAFSSMEDLNKPNEYVQAFRTFSGINSEYGLSDNILNMTNILDRISLSNMNRDVAVLKAQSVSNDNTMATFGVLNVSLDKSSSIPMVVMKHEFKTDNEYEVIQILDAAVGKGNYYDKGDRYIIFAQHLANNASGTWTNIQGDKITNQASQITANVLDAVKDNMGHKINQTTLNIITVLANTAVSHYTSIYNKGEKDINSFAYSSLLTHQAFVSEFINKMNENTRSGQYANKNNSINSVRNDMYSKILSSIYKINILTGDTTVEEIFDGERNIEHKHTILDVYLYHKTNEYNNMPKETAKSKRTTADSIKANKLKRVVKKMNDWIRLLEYNKNLDLYKNYEIASDVLYNDIMDFIQDKELAIKIEEYISNNVENPENNLKSFKSSRTLELLSKLDISRITNNKLFDVDKVGKHKFEHSMKSLKSIDELHEIYKNSIDKGFYDVSDFYESLSKDTYKYGVDTVVEFANFLSQQLDISKLYEHVDKVGDILSKTTSVLRTDKLGSSPDSSVTVKLFEDMSNLYIDFTSFKNTLKNTFYYNNKDLNNLDLAFHNSQKLGERKRILEDEIEKIKYKVETNSFKVTDSNGKDVKVDYSYLKNRLGDLKITKTPLYVGDTQIVESIFPSVVNTTEENNPMDYGTYDFTKSSYPYFEAQYINVNHFSTKVLSDILLSEKPYYKSLMSQLSSRLGLSKSGSSTKRATIQNEILNILVSEHIYNTVPFFNGGHSNPLFRQKEIERVMGKVVLEDYVSKNKSTNFTTSDIVGMDVSEGDDIYTDSISSKDMTFDKFKNLSTANKVWLLKEHLQKFNIKDGISDIDDVMTFLNLLTPNLEREDVDRNGYHRISTNNSSLDASKLQQMFRNMYYNENLFVAQTARDLVRYTFFTSSLKYGNNLSKYIDMSLYYKDNEQYYSREKFAKFEPVEYRLNQYNIALKNLENNSEKEITPDDLEYYLNLIRRQMYDNNSINPIVRKITREGESSKPTFNKPLTLNIEDGLQILDYKGNTYTSTDGNFIIEGKVYKNKKGIVTIGKTEYSVYGQKTFPILVEPIHKIENSYNASNETIKTTIKNVPGFSDRGNIAFKRIDIEGSTNVYYIPFSKTLASEYVTKDNNSIVAKYSKHIDSEQFYLEIIRLYDSNRAKQNQESSDEHESNSLYPISRVINHDANGDMNMSDEYNYYNVLSKSDESYSETAKKMIDYADVILYIGENEFYKKSFKSNKTIYTTLDTINKDTLANVNFQENSKVVIVGDTLSDSNKSQKEIDAIITPTIRNYKYLYPIGSIKTIFKNGIGESVYKAVMTEDNVNNEFIEVGTKGAIHDSLSLLEDNVKAQSILSSTLFDLKDAISKETNVFTTIGRMYNYAKTSNDSNADTFKFDLEYLKSLVTGMSETDNKLAMFEKSLEINMEAVDKVIEHIYRNSIVFPNYKTNEEGVSEDYRFNILNNDFNILQFMLSGNSSHKTILANHLSMYSTYLKAAKEVLDMELLTVPTFTDKEIEEMTDEELVALKSVKDKVMSINTKIQQLQTQFAKDSNGNNMTFGKGKDATTSEILSISRRAILVNLDKRIDSKIKEYFASMIVLYSRNPKFKNTNFRTTVDAILKGQLDENGNFKNTITSDQLAEIYDVMLNYNNDITTVQFWLDTIEETGIPIIDNTMTFLAELRIDNKELHDSRIDELKKLFEDTSFLSNKSLKYDSKREATFRSKFIDENTNGFHTEYNWKKFYTDAKYFDYQAHKHEEFVKVTNGKSRLDSATFDYSTPIKEINGENRKILTLLENPLTVDNVSFTTEIARFRDTFIEYFREYDEERKRGDKAAIAETESTEAFKVYKKIMSNKVTAPELNSKYSYYKFMQITKDGKTYDVLFRTTKKGEVLSKGVSDFQYTLNSNNFYINYEGKFRSLKEISEMSAPAISHDVLDENKNVIGVYEQMSNLDEDYDLHIKNYFKYNLLGNSTLRFIYEKRYNIKFTLPEDDAPKGISKADDAENHSVHLAHIGREYLDVPTVSKIVPIKEEYKNKKYDSLTNEEKQFIKKVSDYINNVVQDVMPNKFFSEDFIPYIFLQNSNTLKDSIKEFIGWRDIQQENIDINIFGQAQHYFQSRVLTAPQMKDSFNIRYKKSDESFPRYEADMIEAANKHLNRLKKNKSKDFGDFKEFTSLEEIYAFNDFIRKQYGAKYANRLAYDIPSILQTFTEELYALKSNKDFMSTFELMENIVNSPQFKAAQKTAKGTTLKDKMSSYMLNETIAATKSGTATNASRRLGYTKDMLFNVSKTQNRFDQILGSINRFTSMNVMWFNYHTGIKNVMKGVSDLYIEAIGNEYANRKEYGKAMNSYRSNIVNFLATVNNHKEQSLLSGIIRRSSELYEDHVEAAINKDTNTIYGKAVTFTEKWGYMTMTSGEHFLQYTSLIALMHSHRVVNGQAFSRDEYIAHRKDEIIKKHLNENEKEALQKYIEYKQKDSSDKYLAKDHIAQWYAYNINKLDRNTVKAIDAELVTSKQEAIKEFESKILKDGKEVYKYRTVFQHYSIKDGVISVDPAFTPAMEAKFNSRVKGLNQSIHGVYNTVDRNALQATLFGEMLLQFRKWMYPNWVRWMGSNYSFGVSKDSGKFSERLGVNRTGAFTDFSAFMRSPYITELYHARQEGLKNAPLIAFRNTLLNYHKFLRDSMIHYRALTPHEQANVRRTLGFISVMVLASVALAGVSLGFDDDDKDKKKPLNLQNWAIYAFAGLQTEYTDIIPYYGWFTFYQRSKRNAVPMERQMLNTLKLIEDLTMYPIRDEEDNYYQNGQYKGKLKLEIDVEKEIPILRQIHKELYLNSSIGYYGMSNPLVNAFNN